jgi:hypothetical protein
VIIRASGLIPTAAIAAATILTAAPFAAPPPPHGTDLVIPNSPGTPAGTVPLGGGFATPSGPSAPVQATAGPIMIEADSLRVLRCTSGEVRPRKLAEEGSAETGVFTGDVSLQWHGASGPGAVLELGIPVQMPGRYSVAVRVAKYRTHGIHQFAVGNIPLGKPVDMFGNPGQDIVTAFTVELGAVHMVAGVHRLVIRVVGTNPDTIMANYGAGLDWVRLTPVPVPGRGGSGVARPASEE